jgi:hypothetical protein
MDDATRKALEPAADVAIEVGEIALDGLVGEEGILTELPGLRTGLAILRAPSNIRDALLSRKVRRFLQARASISEEERARFVASLDAQPGLRERIAIHLVTWLDRLDDEAKVELLARAFRAFVRKEIGLWDLRSMVAAIDRSDFNDLKVFRGFEKHGQCDSRLGLSFQAAGLAAPTRPPLGPFVPEEYMPPLDAAQQIAFVVTEFGEQFARIVLEKPSKSPREGSTER